MKNCLLAIFCIFFVFNVFSQEEDTTHLYKKRVLETTEIEFLSSYYAQKGDNAAVSGGIGTEELTDGTATIVISIPLNDDDILSITSGISAYTSASSSNVNPFDGGKSADPFIASSGASSSDIWGNITGNYSHSSDDRNSIVSANLSFSIEYDYLSTGFGGGYIKLFNEKNTSLSINGNVYLDKWNAIYPSELRPFGTGDGLNDSFYDNKTITGNQDYNPKFTEFKIEGRNSYSVGLGFSQILTKNLQFSLAADIVLQKGLLSTPFQRVYFSDIENSFIENFQLADDIERLPSTRFKTALGGRLNYYINEFFVLRTFYRFYMDDWGIYSNTASIEIPIKIGEKFTFYPSYRIYNQTAAKYFEGYESHVSTEEFYTSDYDLSNYLAHQYGFGVSYTDLFSSLKILGYGLKSVDLKFSKYKRNSNFKSGIITGGIKFLSD